MHTYMHACMHACIHAYMTKYVQCVSNEKKIKKYIYKMEHFHKINQELLKKL